MPHAARWSRLTELIDGGAVLLSGLCLLHCLALPLLVALLPLAAAGFVGDERFHRWMLLAVVPSSVLALGFGWRRHRHWRVVLIGAGAVALIAFAAFAGARLGAHGETALTVAGGLMLAGTHMVNVWLGHRHHDHSRHGTAGSIMGTPDG